MTPRENAHMTAMLWFADKDYDDAAVIALTAHIEIVLLRAIAEEREECAGQCELMAAKYETGPEFDEVSASAAIACAAATRFRRS